MLNFSDKKNHHLSLPEIGTAKGTAVRFVDKAITITFSILIFIILLSIAIIYFVEMELTVDSEGILEPAKITQIHVPESGIIKEVFVKSGDSIAVGQSIAILDSARLLNSLINIRSEIKSNNNNIDRIKKKVEFDRALNKNLFKKAEAQLIKATASFRDRLTSFYFSPNIDSIYKNYKIGSNITLDYSMAEILIAESDLENTTLEIKKLELKEFELNDIKIKLSKLFQEKDILENKLDNILIKSPISGTVLSENVNELQNNYFSEGSFLLTIVQKNKWNAVLFVNERDIHQIKNKNRAKIELNALQSTENFELYDAEVISMASEKINSSDKYSNYNGLYRITTRILLNQKSNLDFTKLKYGYQVKGKIITDSGKIFELLIKYFKDIF